MVLGLDIQSDSRIQLQMPLIRDPSSGHQPETLSMSSTAVASDIEVTTFIILYMVNLFRINVRQNSNMSRLPSKLPNIGLDWL